MTATPRTNMRMTSSPFRRSISAAGHLGNRGLEPDQAQRWRSAYRFRILGPVHFTPNHGRRRRAAPAPSAAPAQSGRPGDGLTPSALGLKSARDPLSSSQQGDWRRCPVHAREASSWLFPASGRDFMAVCLGICPFWPKAMKLQKFRRILFSNPLSGRNKISRRPCAGQLWHPP